MTYFQDMISRIWHSVGRVSLNVALILVLIVLGGCSSARRVLQLETVQTEVLMPEERPVLPNPQPIDQRQVEWRVLTPSTLPEGNDWVFFALITGDYENLSYNTAEILRWIEETMWRLRYYRGDTDNQEDHNVE